MLPPALERVTWAISAMLLHSVWQGALIAGLLVLTLRLTHRRYLAAAAALGGLAMVSLQSAAGTRDDGAILSDRELAARSDSAGSGRWLPSGTRGDRGSGGRHRSHGKNAATDARP